MLKCVILLVRGLQKKSVYFLSLFLHQSFCELKTTVKIDDSYLFGILFLVKFLCTTLIFNSSPGEAGFHLKQKRISSPASRG